ncbi:MAG: methyltransferase, partial [Paludibacter sp.]|nr:methyltransferase [Paludibacter sp.]
MRTNKAIYIEKLQAAIDNKELIRFTLSSPKVKTADLKKIILTAVELKRGYCLNFVYRHTTKDITKNFDIAEGIELIDKAIENEFNNAEMQSTGENILLYTLPNGKIQIKTSVVAELKAPLSLAHDKAKEKLIDLKNNVYLRELGITNGSYELRREMSDKYRQINKYIELLAPNLKEANLDTDFHVVDMGSGKGYLTFALYDYLTNVLKLTPSMTGVEFRPDLVQICNDIANK